MRLVAQAHSLGPVRGAPPPNCLTQNQHRGTAGCRLHAEYRGAGQGEPHACGAPDTKGITNTRLAGVQERSTRPINYKILAETKYCNCQISNSITNQPVK